MPEPRDPKEKKCTMCGKDLYAGEEWAYKRRDGKGKTKWFCSYKCMRAFDAKHDGKNAAVVTADEVAAAPKEPTSRAVLARALVKEIQRGGSVIAYMKAEGYKNPWEAYNAVRHYCETKMPELAEVLKPLKDLPKAPPAQTGRPRKYPAKVETVDKVPEVEQVEREDDLPPWERQLIEMDKQEPVQCIAHVTPVEIQEAEEPPEKIYTTDDVLRIVDEATLNCQKVTRYRWTSDSLEREMYNNSQLNAEVIGTMKLRREIRKKLGAESD